MRRHGTATPPLHTESAPAWLFDQVVELSGAIAMIIIDEFGFGELLRRLSDPYWFQAFGCLLGFDWHFSGVTTTTIGALKIALVPGEHGVMVAGGEGATSRQTPQTAICTQQRSRYSPQSDGDIISRYQMAFCRSGRRATRSAQRVPQT